MANQEPIYKRVIALAGRARWMEMNMRLVETDISHDRIRKIMTEARIERSRAIGAAIRALGRGIAGVFRKTWLVVRRAAGLPEPCASC